MTDHSLSFLHRLKNSIRKRMLSGLLVLLPLGITLFVLQFLLKAMAGVFAPALDPLLKDLPHFAINLISIALSLALIYLTGAIARYVAGKKLIAFGESLIVRIPLIKSIYLSSKQVLDTFSAAQQQRTFKSVVLIEFPAPGMQSVGFVTGTILNSNGQECYKVFIPTTPNPTSGFLQIVPRHKAVETDLGLENALKMVMSAGVLSPGRIGISRDPAGLERESGPDSPQSFP